MSNKFIELTLVDSVFIHFKKMFRCSITLSDGDLLFRLRYIAIIIDGALDNPYCNVKIAKRLFSQIFQNNLGIIILYDKFVNVNIFRWVQGRMGWVIIN